MLSDRGKHRLKLAAGLLRGSGQKLDWPREDFYDKIQEHLATLAGERQNDLKAQVDWVEEYERVEAEMQTARNRQKPAAARNKANQVDQPKEPDSHKP